MQLARVWLGSEGSSDGQGARHFGRQRQSSISIGPTADVLRAAVLMNEKKIGALVVIDDAGAVVGMFTERDVLHRVVAQRRDPATTLVSDVMTGAVLCCQPDTHLDEARAVMKTKRIRHLPVVDAKGALAGMISIGDLNAYLSAGQEQTIHLLQEYMYGRV
jgi:CBS domain-containing protein